MANKNSVLLFGDYGTEVIRLSQLYDPDKCLYQPVSRGDTIDPNKTYYTPELRNKTVFFDVADLSARAGGEFAYDGEYYDMGHAYHWTFEVAVIAETTDQHKHLPAPTIPGPRDY